MHPSSYARRAPDRLAIVMAGSGQQRTYGELDASSNQMAHLFRAAGLGTGDVVAIMMENGPDYLEIAFAAQRSGLYFLCVSDKLTAVEADLILRDAEAKALVVSAKVAAALDIRRLAPGLIGFSIGGEVDGFQDLHTARGAFPITPIPDERAGGDMLYSSGTTGQPKGLRAPLPSDPSISAPTRVCTLGAGLYGMGEDSVYLCPAPLYHAAPLRWSMGALRLGGTVVLMERFNPEAALATIQKYRVTHSQWVPTHFTRLLKLPSETRQSYDLSSMRVVIHAAAPCPPALKEAMLAWWGPIIHEYYSASEGSGFAAITPQEWLTHKGSVGVAKIGRLEICDQDGEPLPPRTEGVVYFADAPPFEYYKDPAKTAESRNRHGWATVGDVGWLDEEGFLYLTDRKSYMIISGGVNVYPQEIESVLITHPDVADVAVFGVPDEDLGERVLAVIQPEAGVTAGAELAERLRAYARERLSAIKTPKQFEFREQLIRSETGKLMKRLIRDDYLASLPAG